MTNTEKDARLISTFYDILHNVAENPHVKDKVEDARLLGIQVEIEKLRVMMEIKDAIVRLANVTEGD